MVSILEQLKNYSNKIEQLEEVEKVILITLTFRHDGLCFCGIYNNIDKKLFIRILPTDLLATFPDVPIEVKQFFKMTSTASLMGFFGAYRYFEKNKSLANDYFLNLKGGKMQLETYYTNKKNRIMSRKTNNFKTFMNVPGKKNDSFYGSKVNFKYTPWVFFVNCKSLTIDFESNKWGSPYHKYDLGFKNTFPKKINIIGNELKRGDLKISECKRLNEKNILKFSPKYLFVGSGINVKNFLKLKQVKKVINCVKILNCKGLHISKSKMKHI